MNKRTILINGKPFTYDDEIEDITYDTISPISEEDARNLLLKTKDLFSKCGIPFYLGYGTLLGAVRDHGLVNGDEDVDVFIKSEERLRNSLPFLFENGLKVCRICEGELYSFHADNKSFIDVYIWGKLPFSIWSLWCDKICISAIPRKYLRKFDTIRFLGVECLCPHKPEKILSFWYGKSWETPIKGHDFTYEVPSRYWWTTKGKKRWNRFVGRCRLLVKDPMVFVKKVCNRLRLSLL